MNCKLIIDLSNRKTIETPSESYYTLVDKLNDTKNPFIDLGKCIIKKEDIILIKKEEIKEEINVEEVF